MKLIKYNWLILLIFSLMACDPEEFFSPVVELDIPPHTSKLVVAADFEPNSDSLRVFVSKSYGFLDPKSLNRWDRVDTVSGVQVQLFKNDVLWTTFTSAKNGYYTSGQTIPLNDHSTYRLQVSAPNFETVTAVQTVPSLVPIVKATFVSQGGVDAFGGKVDLYTIEFNDPANEENFYQAEATWKYQFGANSWDSTTYALTHLASTGDNGNETMLIDKAFNGKTYKWLLQPYFSRGQPQVGDTITVRLQPIAKDRYLYNKSYTLYSDSRDNPFAEPVLLYTNLQKGYGYFTISGGSTKKRFVF
ncbi:MAG: hypothetical protein RIS64_341 [Bacteroidota bacterium]|jgi:hypothetical protein